MACLARGTARPERRFPTAAASCSWRRVDTPRTDNHVPAEHAGRGAGPPHMAPAFAPTAGPRRHVETRPGNGMMGPSLTRPAIRGSGSRAGWGTERRVEVEAAGQAPGAVAWVQC
jgi:hypothetical protein